MQSHSFTFRLPDDIRSELERIAKEDDRTLSSLIIKVLRNYIKNQPNANTRD